MVKNIAIQPLEHYNVWRGIIIQKAVPFCTAFCIKWNLLVLVIKINL